MADVTLRAGELEVVVSPGHGGSIRSFRAGGFDLLHPWDGVTAGPRGFGCFALLPFSGRVDQARFTFAGRTFDLPRNAPGSPHSIHGDGWQQPWRLLDVDERSLGMGLARHGPDAAFRFDAEQHVRLQDDALEVRLAVTHQGDASLPYGLGLHPYFPRRPGTRLSAEVTGVWAPDASNIPRSLEPVPPAQDFRHERNVSELELDHNFQGWNGEARILWPEQGRGLLISASAIFRHLVVYVPPERDFFCVEPVSHVADGVNMLAAGVAGTGMRVLAPGERLEGSVRFTPLPRPTPSPSPPA